jgi:two-component system, LytTR family, sensor histidine kinase AlgZ
MTSIPDASLRSDLPQRRSFLPNFCSLRVGVALVISGELLAVVLTLASVNALGQFWARLGPLSFYTLLIVIASAVLLCALGPLLRRLDDRLTALVAWLLVLAVAVAASRMAHLAIPWGDDVYLLPDGGTEDLMVRSLGISTIFAALLMRYLYLDHLWRRQVEAEAEARFQKLQARIRPHFLFNSLNTIANVIQTDPDLAEELLQDMADLFRATLAKPAELSTLTEELVLAARYLHLEKQRLGDRLNLEWDVEDLPGAAQLPPLILQPLVENAIYHGIQPSKRPGWVRVAGVYRFGVVNLSIRNTLPGPDEPNRHTDGNRMALDNVRQRMAAMFRGAAQVLVSRFDGEYQIRLVFPYPWRER